MDCRQIELKIPLWLEGEEMPLGEAEAVAGHVQVCAYCQGEAEFWQTLNQTMREEAQDFRAPPGFVARVMEGIRELDQQNPPLRAGYQSGWKRYLAWVAALIILAIGSFSIYTQLNSDLEPRIAKEDGILRTEQPIVVQQSTGTSDETEKTDLGTTQKPENSVEPGEVVTSQVATNTDTVEEDPQLAQGNPVTETDASEQLKTEELKDEQHTAAGNKAEAETKDEGATIESYVEENQDNNIKQGDASIAVVPETAATPSTESVSEVVVADSGQVFYVEHIPQALLSTEKSRITERAMLQIKVVDLSASYAKALQYINNSLAECEVLGSEEGQETLKIVVDNNLSGKLQEDLKGLGQVLSQSVQEDNLTSKYNEKVEQYLALQNQAKSAASQEEVKQLQVKTASIEAQLKAWDREAGTDTIILWLKK